MKKVIETQTTGIDAIELLMDETLCEGRIVIPKMMVKQAGGVNQKLKAGKKYELMMRIAEMFPIELIETNENAVADNSIILEDDTPEKKQDYGWKTDCYIASKYAEKLQKRNLFDVVIQTILEDGNVRKNYNETVYFLELMLKKSEEYYRIDDMTKPILIYKGDDICHNVLTVFAEEFGNALEQMGKNVIYFDMAKEPIGNVTRYMNQHFCAIIGVQSYMFSIKLSDEKHYIHEYIYGPKFNFIFDHPIWLKNHLNHHLQYFTVLTLDDNYVDFVKKHFKMNAILFPPAGIEKAGEEQKKYGLTFIGTYNDYRSQLPVIHQMNRSMRFFANHLLSIMRKNTWLTAEDAFDRTVKERRLILSENEYLDLFYEMRRVFYCVIHYYREHVLKTIVDNNIKVDVFGDSWKDSLFYGHPNVIWHPDVTVEESITIWKQSKLSLNIMSWHKAGFTERMANIMLAEAVLVTDDTAYLNGRYNENDMLVFQLNQLEKLPSKIQKLLSDDKKRIEIAENGRKKTKEAHTWQKRAQSFVDFLSEIE